MRDVRKEGTNIYEGSLKTKVRAMFEMYVTQFYEQCLKIKPNAFTWVNHKVRYKCLCVMSEK